MRIAQVSPRYYPNIGGVEKVVQNISEELVKKGHDVEVLTADARNFDDISFLLNGVTVKRFPANGPFYYSSELYKYLVAQGNKYDVVHAHSFHTLLPLLCAKAKEVGINFRLVLTGHYHGKGRTYLTSLLLKSGRKLFGKFYKQADLVLGLTEFEKSLLIAHFQLNKNVIKIISNGVDIDEINAAKSFEKKGKILLIVSRLEKYKNIHLAIQAMPYLPEDYRLAIIGDGPYRQHLKNLVVTLGMDERVSFLGRLPNEEVYRWYKTCDLVINLSELEAFGLTVIEGLAAGKPVLVNNRTALSELAGRFEGVTAVDARRSHLRELAGAIVQRMGARCQEADLNAYRWGGITEGLLHYYIGL